MKTANKLTVLMTLILSTVVSADELDGYKLFKNNCSACHISQQTTTENNSNLIGPPINYVMTLIKEKFSEKADATAYMQDYILNPQTDKALSAMGKKYLAKMPSMKGVITDKEAKLIIDAVYDRYPEIAKDNNQEQKALNKPDHIATLFQNNCVACHTPKLIDPLNKRNLIGPPADEVLMHVKEKFADKDKAVAFMSDYIMNPDSEKALCASMDKFGIMPSIKGTISKEEALAITSMMYDTFPHKDFKRKETKSRSGISFKTIDTNNDGGISPQEFINFRAKRNNLDPKQFKHDLYFKKVDLDGDGKMSPDEFKKMRASKMKMKQ